MRHIMRFVGDPGKMAAEPSGQTGLKRKYDRNAEPPKHVALIVEAAIAPRRLLLTGIARYIQEHEPWCVYLKPVGVEQDLPHWLQEWEGDGIIVSASDPDNSILPRRGIAVVDLFGTMRERGYPMVHADDFAVGKMGAEHLISRGFRTFGFWRYVDKDAAWSTRRLEGFRAALPKGAQCQVYETRFPKAGSGGPYTWEQQQRELVSWLAKLPKPTGIMTSTDLMGQQMLEACQRAAINVPEELAVIGVDNDEPICRIATPPLSSVILNDHQRGYEAAALLARLMNGERVPREPIWIQPAGVVSRASTDIMAIDDASIVKALRFLRENARFNISVDDLVKEISLSRSVLERRFRKVVGRTIGAEIVRLRVDHAIELLCNTNMELKAIAYHAGFGSQAYMNAVFKKKMGKTPGSYRDHLRGSAADGTNIS
jgi:LacI family transcriptional regulator